MPIRIFITGGTIDGLEYDSLTKAPQRPKTLIQHLLDDARVTNDYAVEVLMQKDSKFIDDADREQILQKCKECKEDKILISHGTITMAQTAKYLGRAKIKKTIVLVGAMVPASKKHSDAPLNLGAAFMAVQCLDPGAYIVMNGRVFSWKNVRKNTRVGRFEFETVE